MIRDPRRILLTLAAALALLLSTGAPASAQGQGTFNRLRERTKHLIDKKLISGAVTEVGSPRGVEWYAVVGQRNLDVETPMEPETLFRIASMTKPITAIGIMMLADEGKLSVDDPVEKHLPEFKGQMLVAEKTKDSVTLKKPSRPITLRDLLTHTSGLSASPPFGVNAADLPRPTTLEEAVALYSRRTLETEPGTKWAYSNAGIDTLGRVIEVVSDDPYESFLQTRLFDPLGMPNTTFFPTPDQRLRAAVTYDSRGGELKPVFSNLSGLPEPARYPSPAGGLWSTAPDLAKLYTMMLNQGVSHGVRLLSKSAVAEMTRVQTGDLKAGFVDGSGWGLGWGVVKEPRGVTSMLSPGTFGHGGAWGTQAWIDPVKHRFIVILFQRAGLKNSDESEIRRELQEAAFGEALNEKIGAER